MVKIKIVSQWDVIVKLLDSNKIEIHLERDKSGIIFLYLINKNTPKDKFILPDILPDYQTIKEYVNNISIYNFRKFYEELINDIKIMKNIHEWYTDLNIQYQKGELK